MSAWTAAHLTDKALLDAYDAIGDGHPDWSVLRTEVLSRMRA